MASLAISNRRRFELEYEARVRACRTSFKLFRKTINPKTKWGWFTDETAEALQQFAMDLLAGKRPKLVIEAPPQHGKSVQVVDLIAWLAGLNPDLRTIYTSFSERLGVRANLRLQRIYDSKVYQDIFPETRINQGNVVTISSQFLRNRTVIEYQGREGYFRNTTVEGSITGESLDLGIIDDPIKGRKEANSITKRDAAWEWLTDDFFTRFSEDAGLLCILTRWHIDDPIGRLVQRFPEVKVLKYKAIAEHDEPNRKAGQPLFPELKSLEFLLERKSLLDSASWMSLYQQSPVVIGGEIIKGEWFGRWTVLPKFTRLVMFGDTAQKAKEANDYSVFQLWGLGVDGRIYLVDQIRGKWEAPELKRRTIDFWLKYEGFDGIGASKLMIEDKSSGTGLIQEIKAHICANGKRIPVFGIPRSIDKYSRVQDALPSIEAGHVVIPAEAPWVADFVAENEAFTADDSHAFDDQIDPMCDAVKELLQTKIKRGFFSAKSN